MITNPPPNPSWRKPAGIFAILMLIAVWASIVLMISPAISDLHIGIQSLFYLVAGTVWILPLKPLLGWMETGKWRIT